MHKESPLNILAECNNGYISVCECCNEFNFAYKNILLTFQEEDMLRFFDWIIENRNSPHHFMPMHHGRSKVFSSPNSNLFLVFHDNELDEVVRMYNETRLILEARKVLLQNRMN